MHSWLPGIVVVFAAASAPAAPTVGWVRATGQLDSEAPARYTPLNLLDGLAATAWCTRGADALSETVSFGTTEPVTLTKLQVATGNGATDKTFQTFSRARKLRLHGADAAATIQLEDLPGLQTVNLEKPIRGQNFTLEVLDQFSTEDPLAPVCLSDVLPFAGTVALAGPALRKWLVYQPGRAELEGVWYGGPEGSPDRTLTFFLDGSWRYGPEGPAAKVTPSAGKWSTQGSRLWLTLPGKGKVEAKARFERRPAQAGAPAKGGTTLTLDGSVGELKQTFRDRR